MNNSLQVTPIQGLSSVAGLGGAPARSWWDLGLARNIQNTLVPAVIYEDARVEVFGQTIPREDAGGDLADLVVAGGDIIAYVADVSGHGLPAAVLMGMVKTAVRYGLHLGQDLAVLLEGLNHVLPGIKDPNMYATFAGLRFDGSNEVEYITAGHVPLLQYRRRHKDIVRCSMSQFPLGLFGEVAYVSRRVPYEAGDIFVLVTDGIIEAADGKEVQFGFDRLEPILCELAAHPLSEIFNAAFEAVTGHGVQRDDQTLMLVRTLSAGRPNPSGVN